MDRSDGGPRLATHLVPGYLHEVDGLRALAVLSVVAYHLSESFLPGGFTGVDVFFVISGYVVSKSLAEHSTERFSAFLMNFYGRRMVRILPALLVCLIIVSLFTVLFVPHSWLSRFTDQTAIAATVGLSNFALIMFNDGYFSPQVEYNPFVHTWSLAVEEQFYLIFPMLFFAWAIGHKRGDVRDVSLGVVLPILALASLATAYWLGSSQPDWAFYLILARFWELAAGVMLYQFHAQERLLPRSATMALAGLSAGIVITAIGFWFSQPARIPWPWALLPVIGTAVMISSVARPQFNVSMLHKSFRHPVVVYTGKLSYSLYLWHWPVFTLFRWTVGLEWWLYMVLACGITWLLAASSYHFVEKKFRYSTVVRSSKVGSKLVTGLAAIILAYVVVDEIFSRPQLLSLSVTRDVDSWYSFERPINQRSSSGLPLENKRLFLVGDSHASAYETLISEAANKLGFGVHRQNIVGCNLTNLLQPIGNREGCEQTSARLIKFLEGTARRGDLVFFATLRMRRLSGQWKRYDAPIILASSRSIENEKHRLNALRETSAIVDRLSRMGLTVLIDAPKPVFPGPAFRCSDWFNRVNPICDGGLTVARSSLLEFRLPTMQSIAELDDRFDNIITWDPFPVLCPNETCSPYDSDGKPLFFDGDHLSGHGNRVLSQSFEQILLQKWLPLTTAVAK